MDQILIDARNDSVRLEQIAVNDLRANIAGYLPPSWTVRRMIDGYEDYVASGNTREDAYLLMRRAFTETEGASTRVFSEVIGSHIRKRPNDLSATMFEGEDWENVVRTAVYHLNHHGFWKARFRVPAPLVDSLKAKILRRLEGDNGAAAVAGMLEGRQDAPLQVKTKSSWFTTFEEMYAISSDPVMLEIVQTYMGVPPIFNTPVAFLNSHAKIRNQADLSKTAQLYHHDLHRLGFVKLFVYLTDVDLGAGPHTLVRGTHRDRPAPLWEDGRHTDEAIEAAGLKPREERIVGPAGTVFLVDTSALHKGEHPESTARLMAQVQYTNSLFGYPLGASDHKVELARTSKNEDVQTSAALVRKYADKAGVRFMQNLI